MPVVERQARDLGGDGEARPELVGLHDGALRQLAAGDAGGEAEVVLDPHAAAGLAAGRRALQHHRAQPLGGAVDRRGQPRRPGADDDQVVHRLLQRPAEAEGLRQLAVRGVAQQQLAAPGDHGRVGLGQPELLEQLLHLRVGLQVQPGERHPVLGQEVADPEGVRRVARADHAQAREVPRLAESCRRAMNACRMTSPRSGWWFRSSPQGVGRHLVDLAIAPGDAADERRAAGQLRHVAGELPGLEDRDGLRRLAGFVHGSRPRRT